MPFPGVITNVVDRSFFTANFSRFRAGLVGVTERGPFDEIVAVATVQDFLRNFGRPIAGTFLADTVALVSQTSDGCRVVRVGAQYEELADGNASGTSGTYTIATPSADLFDAGSYVRIRQVGKRSTVNARVDTVGVNELTLVSVGAESKALADEYTAATIDQSGVANAASEAEGFLYSPSWTAVAGAGTAQGDKNAYQIVVSGDETEIAVGDLLRLTQTDRFTTREIRVRQVRANKTVLFEVVNNTEIGYQALPLQDSYTAATIEKLVAREAEVGLHLRADTAGTWANTTSTRGLRVLVSPGSSPDTKKFLVYNDGVLVETIDNLSDDSTSENYYITRINDRSSYLAITAVTSTEPPTNSWLPWNLATYSRINYNSFAGGYNGENVSTADIVGTINPVNDSPTGLKLFQDPDITDIDFLCVPGNSSIGVFQEIARIAALINAIGIGDIPDGLNAREAIDWQNGQGLYASNGKIDNYRMALYWNWWTMTSTFTGAAQEVPPSLGALRALARTFDQDKPWFAAAGEIRGSLPEALGVTYETIPASVRDAMYGNGNSVNPIFLNRGRIMVYGERTLQRADSKLTAVHNVVLVNYILKSFSTIARRYIFDPNDEILLTELRLEYTNFLESVKSERGLEAYNLVIDETNNTAATRNNRQVIVDLAIIPIDAVEQIIVNVVVEESGAQLVQSN